MSRTAVVIIVGLVLLALFLVVGVLARKVRRAMEDFVLVWFALAAGNLALGVLDAGYGLAEELPIFLLIFVVPAVPAAVVWWRTARH